MDKLFPDTGTEEARKRSEASQRNLLIEQDDPTVLAMYVERGLNVNSAGVEFRWTTASPYQYTPLLFFAKSPDMVVAMVRHGADVNCRDNEGFTSLHRAMLRPNPEVVRTLIQMGADVSLNCNHGFTALEGAVARIVVNTSSGGILAMAAADAVRLNVETFSDEIRRVSQVAFAMGLLPRLGHDSRVMRLDPDMLRMILDYV
jgi:hypothetical protein